jgi:hypothetical protein
MLKVKYNRQRMLLEGNLPLKVMGRESIRECWVDWDGYTEDFDNSAAYKD